ncbi:AraC family transcriptional regulator [Pseudomonas parafulva]|uniref:AraC family transcriptional regulator n=1 Tax=Pseudomonas parafulva TaxID=157782 RepID=A0AAI8KFT9_9PSED|nr:AraC family transcriptional regulator [Pseudomonas parafulva]AXO90725.1 AraC family transcriptional regulator [Pseudomonas parafulva]
MNQRHTLIDIIRRHAPSNGFHPTPLAGVTLVRSDTPTVPMPVVYQPTLCYIVQGRKQVSIGATTYVYDAANYLVASVDMPVMGSIIEASEAEPYLCLVLDLDRAVLSELALRHPTTCHESSASTPSGIELNGSTPELLDAVSRLARLLDTPQDAAELAPLVIREVLYRLLTRPGNQMLLQMATADSRLRQIAKAITWLRAHYQEPVRIDDVAGVAGMSRSTFHVHFKAVTSMSPLEFRCLLRLQEARRLMVAEALDAAGAGYRVGYESPSQFSRDYARVFGLPPARDAVRLRSGAL